MLGVEILNMLHIEVKPTIRLHSLLICHISVTVHV